MAMGLEWNRLLPVLFCLHVPGDTLQCSTCYQTFRQHIYHLDQHISQNVHTLWRHNLFQKSRHLEQSHLVSERIVSEGGLKYAR